jgi:hypothetical protein
MAKKIASHERPWVWVVTVQTENTSTDALYPPEVEVELFESPDDAEKAFVALGKKWEAVGCVVQILKFARQVWPKSAEEKHWADEHVEKMKDAIRKAPLPKSERTKFMEAEAAKKKGAGGSR